MLYQVTFSQTEIRKVLVQADDRDHAVEKASMADWQEGTDTYVGTEDFAVLDIHEAGSR